MSSANPYAPPVAEMKDTAHLPLEELFAASHRATNDAGRMDDTAIILLERCR